MASLKDLAGDTPPVIGYPKSIEFGPVRLDGYMLENGEFRQSVHSTETALGAAKSKIITRMLVPRFEGSTPVASSQTPVVATGLTQNGVENGGVVLEYFCNCWNSLFAASERLLTRVVTVTNG